MKVRLILISKDKSDSPTIERTRPILILPAITKFFEYSSLHIFENIVQSNKFCKNQRGFTKEKSTLDNIKDVMSLAMNIKVNKLTKDSPALMFFNFIKAYDSRSRDRLIRKLLKIGIPWNIVKLIRNMLNNFTLIIEKEAI